MSDTFVMGPRADFACKKCGDVIPDLPVACVRCPICNSKRGFFRLFNAVNVMSGKTYKVGKFLDKKLTPALDLKSSKEQGAKRFETAAQEALEKAVEKATPEQRAAADMPVAKDVKYQPQMVGAAAALGMLKPHERADNRQYIWPAIKRHLKPIWHDKK